MQQPGDMPQMALAQKKTLNVEELSCSFQWASCCKLKDVSQHADNVEGPPQGKGGYQRKF